MNKVLAVIDSEPDDLLMVYLLVKNYGTENVEILHLNNKKNTEWEGSKKIGELVDIMGINRGLLHSNIELEEIKSLLSRSELIFWTCDFTPLFEIYKSDPELCSGLTIYSYGSVNFRWCYSDLPKPEQEVFFEMLNNGFKKLFVFETYHAFGPKNSANRKTTPELANCLINPQNEALKYVMEQTRQWNSTIVKSCIEDIKKNLPEVTDADIERMSKDTEDENHTYAKIIKNISENEEFQMVFADFALPVLIGHAHYKPRVASFGQFVALSEVPESRLHYFITPEEEKEGFMSVLDSLLSAKISY